MKPHAAHLFRGWEGSFLRGVPFFIKYWKWILAALVTTFFLLMLVLVLLVIGLVMLLATGWSSLQGTSLNEWFNSVPSLASESLPQWLIPAAAAAGIPVESAAQQWSQVWGQGVETAPALGILEGVNEAESQEL